MVPWRRHDCIRVMELGNFYDDQLETARGNHLKQLSEEHNGSDNDPDWYAPVGWSVSPAANFITMWGEIKKATSALR